jgi:hypothetical protein
MNFSGASNQLPSVFPQSTATGLSSLGSYNGQQGWNNLVASRTGPGVNAAAAAHKIHESGMYTPERRSRGEYDGRGHTTWQQAVSNCIETTGQPLQVCSHQLGQFGTGAYEQSVGHSPKSSRRTRSRSPSRNTGMYDGAYNGYSRFTPQQLGASIDQSGRLAHLDREGYQALIEEITQATRMNAAQAAHMLGQVYDNYKNVPHLSRGEWQNAIAGVTQQYGVNAAQAARILHGVYQGGRSHSQPWEVTNASVTAGSAFNGMYNGNRSHRKYDGAYNGSLLSTGSERTQIESGLGKYSGLSSYRGGTPGDSNDMVVDMNTASQITAEQASNSPRHITKSSFPGNESYLKSDDLRKVAQALGVNPDGSNRLLVQSIKNRVNEVGPYRAMGALSPRSQSTLQGLM